MKYILLPVIACLTYVFVLVLTFDHRQARKLFLDIIDPEGFHYY